MEPRGIEEQTRKLFEVCRLRDVPIITFVNKARPLGARSVRPVRSDRAVAGARRNAGLLLIGMGRDFLDTLTCSPIPL